MALAAWAALWASVAGAKPAPPAPPTPPPPGAPAEADWRTPDPQDILVLETTKGRVIIEMNPRAAPNHVARIRELARSGAYDGRAFFRVIADFMDQTGDPLDSGMGTSSLPSLKAEFTFRRGADTPFVPVSRSNGTEGGIVGSLPVISQTMDLGMLTVDHRVEAWGAYCAGVAGMARGDDPDSANSQYFLVRTNTAAADHASHGLDRRYTAWGRTLVGQEVIDQIKAGEPPPPPADRVQSAKILADLPAQRRPMVRVVDPASAWFKAEIAYEKAAQGADFSVCSVKLPAEVK
ncbi:MAG: peptidylprolyl isomerase [Caulobacteraceae bacterium]|nr:peptidylprolyl isomerase [Caulobacteraceae bacterium]